MIATQVLSDDALFDALWTVLSCILGRFLVVAVAVVVVVVAVGMGSPRDSAGGGATFRLEDVDDVDAFAAS